MSGLDALDKRQAWDAVVAVVVRIVDRADTRRAMEARPPAPLSDSLLEEKVAGLFEKTPSNVDRCDELVRELESAGFTIVRTR